MNYRCCEVDINMSLLIEPYVQLYQEYVGEENLMLFAIGTSLAIVLLTLLIWKLLSSQGIRRRGILIVGLSNSGKTLLLSKLVTGKSIKTLTSLRENEAVYNSEDGTLNLLDLPGQEAIRQKFFDQYKHTARGILFLVDSSTFSKDIKEVAEMMYTVLSDDNIQKGFPSVLVACNKQDLLSSKSKKLIQSQLEKEINTLRKTRSAALTSIDSDSEKAVYLGVKGKDFEFSHLGKVQVDFAECNVKGDSEEQSCLNEIESWLQSLV